MTSHQIAIAKASFSAGLLRPDPTSVPRDEITYFHDTLDRTLARCSPANIQTCKSWLLSKVIPSAKRVGVLGKYLAALAVSFESGSGQHSDTAQRKKGSRTSSKRKRLHILYLLNDLLHHTKYHGQNPSAFSTLSSAIQPYMVELIDLAAGYEQTKYPKHHRRLNDLLEIWGSNGYYSQDYIHKLRQTLENASTPEAISAKAASKDDIPEMYKKTTPKDPPFVMPASHGDPNSPWHELPAGNLVPLIVPNSSTPIRSLSVKPLQFLAGPADESLVKAVKSLLKDVDRIYSASGSMLDGETIVDIDELGQRVTRDESTGEIIEADGYYGWSRPFCQKMKERRDGKPRSRSRSRSRSGSEIRGRSASFSPPKRRRFSESSGDEGFRSRSGTSSSNRMRRRRYSVSRSRTRSRSPRRSRLRSSSYSPAPTSPREAPHNVKRPYARPPPPPATPQHGVQPPFPGLPQNTMPHITPQPGMFPTPPRPPNYHGPWPPPPPPMPPHVSSGSALPPNMGLNAGMGMNMNMGMVNMNIPGYGSSFSSPNAGPPFPPPPPPPPPPHGPSHAHPYPAPFPYPTSHPNQGSHQPYNRNNDQGSGRSNGGGRGGWNQGGWS